MQSASATTASVESLSGDVSRDREETFSRSLECRSGPTRPLIKFAGWEEGPTVAPLADLKADRDEHFEGHRFAAAPGGRKPPIRYGLKRRLIQ